ncbi:MAG: DUF2007 domain-containing protein [Pseudomonadales bacterium]|nr:DUF2007 domain-containing protein [Pseudomonadales bacterium]
MAARFTRRVYIGDTPAEAWHIRNVLDQHGIVSELRNETLFGATGEIPVLESLPEVWVSEVNLVAAEALIKEIRRKPDECPVWRCDGCSEVVDGVFAICWRCGASASSSG